MLTPLDLNNKNFSKGFRGYDTEEVDEFFAKVAKDFERLYQDNVELKRCCGTRQRQTGILSANGIHHARTLWSSHRNCPRSMKKKRAKQKGMPCWKQETAMKCKENHF